MMMKSFSVILCGSIIAITPLAGAAQAHDPILDEVGEEIVATFSIVAWDPATEELAVAVQSRAFRAAAIVSYAKAGVGAVATQASANQYYGPEGLSLLEQGRSPEEVVRQLTGADPGRDRRQLAVIDARGRVKAYTGSGTSDWAGHIEGENYSVQGNILAGEAVVREMARAFEAAEGVLAERLMAALDAGQAAGGDARGKQSGGILIVKPIGDSRRTTDRWVDVRVDDHPTPFVEIRRLMNMAVARNQSTLAADFAQDGRLAEALRAQRKAVALAPESDRYLFQLAELYARDGSVPSALTTLTLAIDRNPDWRARATTSDAFAAIRGNTEFRRVVGEGR
jgi:uncharacterized Ntn-hydrolase superfamily protein